MKKNVHQVIVEYLSRGEWCAPFEVRLQVKLSGLGFNDYDAITARIRDLRKPQYGGYHVPKRRRKGTDYYEYRIEQAEQKAA